MTYSTKTLNVLNGYSFGLGGGKTFHQLPNIYKTVASETIQKGALLYPKPGVAVFFYYDSNGAQRITKSKNQVQDPARGSNELVGVATGKSVTGTKGLFFEVNWTNTYIDHNFLKPDKTITEEKIGWVDSSLVTWQNISNLKVPKGYYIYPKKGEMIFFYADFNGNQRQLRNKNQVQEPQRSGNELVGTATGNVQTGQKGAFIEVDWINSYIDHGFLGIGGTEKHDPRTGWVDASKVTWQSNYLTPEEKEANDAGNNQPGTTQSPDDLSKTSGFDTATLGYIAIGAALLLTNRNRKK